MEYNGEIILRDAYRLLCLIVADKAIYDMTPEDQQVWGRSRPSEEVLFRLHHTFTDEEISHALINLAIFNRTHMDNEKQRHNIDYPDAVCGQLRKNVDSKFENWIALTFREACNKVIHAEQLSFTFLKEGVVASFVDNNGPMEPMHHEVWLSGEQSKKGWLAKLDVLKFIRATTNNFARVHSL